MSYLHLIVLYLSCLWFYGVLVVFANDEIPIGLVFSILDYIKEDGYWRYIIFTDSLSLIQSLDNEISDNPLVMNLIEKLSNICNDSEIIFCWLPSHIGIRGNEDADTAAKDALLLDVLPFKVPFTDFKPLVNSFIHEVWYQTWNDPANKCNKLYSIKQSLGDWPLGTRTCRREEIVLARLRIGHTYLTQSYLLKREEPPQCVQCNTILTVKHILIECVDLAPMRARYYQVDNMKLLFETVRIDLILDFLREINVFRNI